MPAERPLLFRGHLLYASHRLPPSLSFKGNCCSFASVAYSLAEPAALAALMRSPLPRDESRNTAVLRGKASASLERSVRRKFRRCFVVNNLACLRTGFAKATAGQTGFCEDVLWEIRLFRSISGLWTFVQSRPARCSPPLYKTSRL